LHARPNCCDQVARIAPKYFRISPDAFLDDALDRAAPASWKNTHSPSFSIRGDDGGNLRLARLTPAPAYCDQSVSNQKLRRHCVNAMDQIGMNLAQRDERPASAQSWQRPTL